MTIFLLFLSSQKRKVVCKAGRGRPRKSSVVLDPTIMEPMSSSRRRPPKRSTMVEPSLEEVQSPIVKHATEQPSVSEHPSVSEQPSMSEHPSVSEQPSVSEPKSRVRRMNRRSVTRSLVEPDQQSPAPVLPSPPLPSPLPPPSPSPPPPSSVPVPLLLVDDSIADQLTDDDYMRILANPPQPTPLSSVESSLVESSLELEEEIVFGEPNEYDASSQVVKTVQELEEAENLLIQSEEIQKMFGTNVDGTRVPKMNYFDELSQYNESQKKVDKVEGQFYRFMFRWTEHERNTGFANPEHVVESLVREGQLKDYAFQLEKGEQTNKLHYQGFVKFSDKKRARMLGRHLNSDMYGVRVKPACAPDSVCVEYVTKPETRVQGPYRKLKLDKLKFPEIVPVVETPYDWQKEVLSQMSGSVSHRQIHWIFDGVGNSGKTILCKYVVLKNQGTSDLAYYLGYAKAWDVKYALSKIRDEFPKILIFDFPRTKPMIAIAAGQEMNEIYSVIEEIKNGIYLSTKFESSMVVTPIPHVFVFSNELPPMNALSSDSSSDRWKFYRIGHQSRKLYHMDTEQLLDVEHEIFNYMRKVNSNRVAGIPFSYSEEFLQKWGA